MGKKLGLLDSASEMREERDMEFYRKRKKLPWLIPALSMKGGSDIHRRGQETLEYFRYTLFLFTKNIETVL